MTETELHWKASDGLELFAHEWRPEGDLKGVLTLAHGMGEHSGRYQHVAEFFGARGYALLAFDHRGHGESEGQRGHAPSYEQLLSDVDQLLIQAAERFPNLPVILYGHSMGGNVILNYLLRKKPTIRGAIVTSPWLKLAYHPPRYRMILARLMNRVYPRLSRYRKSNSRHLSRDPAIGKSYEADPLCHSLITPRFFCSIQDAGSWALENAHSLTVPTLLMHGSGDLTTSYDASKAFADKAPADLLQWRSWDGLYHEMHNEIVQDQVLAAIMDFSDDLLSTAGSTSKARPAAFEKNN